MDKFNVIWEDNGKFVPYDVMPYLIEKYNSKRKSEKPVTFDEFKEFVKSESMYMWWSRSQYEIIICDWPFKQKEDKWDIYRQIELNIDVITDILMKNVE